MHRLLTANSFCRGSGRLPQPLTASTSSPLTIVRTFGGRSFDRRDRERPSRDEERPGRDRFEGRGRDRRDAGEWEDRGERPARGERSKGDLGSWLERRASERDVERQERATRSWGDDEEGEGRRERPMRRGGDRERPPMGGSGPGGFKYTRDRRREEGRPATLKESMQGAEVLYGVSAVLAALEAGRRRPYRLLVQDTLINGGALSSEARKDALAVERARKAAEDLGAAVVIVEKHDLNCLVDNRPHQGLALDCSALEPALMDAPPPTTSRFEGRAFPLWLALDEVTDPQNLGAILRSAFFLGADGVLLCSKNSAPLGGVASKASAGALEHFDHVMDVPNLPRFLDRCREEGWAVMGADAGSDSKDVRTLDVTRPTVLVMGSEGFGLRTNVRRACSEFAMIGTPLSGRELKGVDSLNVSVATACLLHELLGKIATKQQ